MFLLLRPTTQTSAQHLSIYGDVYFMVTGPLSITAGHVNGKKQPLQQADEKFIVFSCLTLLTISEDN